jgi:antirestriction protein ArdC|tara:strand:+ start:176 stop:1252 length:1077 start_codon:yes stop_codon:yes gene_type:complete
MVINTKQIKEKSFIKGVPDFVTNKVYPIIENAVEKWKIGVTTNIQTPRLFSFTGKQYNGIWGNYYKGSNMFFLSLWKQSYGYEHDAWIPQTQVTKLYKQYGIQLKKGSVSIPILFANWKFTSTGQEILKKHNLKPSVNVWKVKAEFPKIWELVKNNIFYTERWWNSFNVECFDNLLGTKNEKLLKTPKDHESSIKNKETLKLDTKNDEKFIDDITINMENKPNIKFGLHRVSNYRPSQDLISVRPSNEMLNYSFFYETLVHELIHSTGHENRLDRHSKLNYLKHDHRSTEELVAELGMFMSLDRVDDKDLDKKQIYNNVGQYLKSWLEQDNTKAKKIEKLMIASEFADQSERYIFDPK